MKRLLIAGALAAGAVGVASQSAAAPPAVTLTSPTAGVISGSKTLNVSLSGPAVAVRYYAGNTLIGQDLTAPAFDESWDTRTLADGSYALRAEATNSAGEIGVSPTVQVTIDNVPDTTTTTSTSTTSTTTTTTTTLPPTTTTLPPPSGGCPAGWYLAEAQSWWWQDSLGPDKELDARHVHIGGCVTHRDTQLSGVVPFPVTVKLHNTGEGYIYYLAIVVKTDSIEKSFSVNPGWECATADCTFNHTFNLDMAQFDKAGRQEIRFRASMRQPDLDNQEIRGSINFQATIVNGKTVNPIDRLPWLRGKGWYTDMLYCEAGYRDDLTPIPSGPVSGVWTPNLRQVDHDAGDAPLTRHTVRVDPDIHHGYPGQFLVDGPLEREGPLAIDTTQLPNGPHKLMIHSECEGPDGINSGVLIVSFTVEN